MTNTDTTDVSSPISEDARIHGRIIGKGEDSKVFLLDQQIYKYYDKGLSGLTLEEVQRYADLTNQSAQILEEDALTKTFRFFGDDFISHISVNPVSEVRTSSRGVPLLIAPYVRGPTPESLFFENTHFRADDIRDLDEDEHNFMEELYSKFHAWHGDIPDEVRKQELESARTSMYSYLDDTSSLLNERLQVTGIKIMDRNVKIRAIPEERKLHFIVTDIGAKIKEIQQAA